MKFVYTFLIILFSAIFANASVISERDVEKSLHLLDVELNRCDGYKTLRVAHLDSLKSLRSQQLATDTIAWLQTTMEIAKGYNSFNNDSSLVYYTQGYDCSLYVSEHQKGNEIGEAADNFRFKFRVRRATYMSLSGLVYDALNEYEALDTNNINPDLKRVYYESGRQMFSYIASYYSNWLSVHDYWQNRSVESQRRLLPLLDPTSDKYLLNLGEYYFNIREYTHSKDVLLNLLNRIDDENPNYAIATHILASIALIRGDRNEYIYYLTKSAIADIRHATLEVTSLQELAGVLYEAGDKSRAHNYISEALSNAVESRASVRMMQTTELLKMVEEDHNSQIAKWRSWMYTVIAVLAVVLIALLVSMFFLRRQLNRVARMKQELQDANNTKDVYISQFLSLCSIYMDKVKQLCKLANRKISAGQVDELYKITKSGKFIEEQSVEFYKVFDDAFLHIYPNFVAKVNDLLRPEEQIKLNEGETLNSDLRILAFMRLGIDDTTRVAQILNFSVNTIYAYRNRMRNRAINRDTFETDIMGIGSIEEEP